MINVGRFNIDNDVVVSDPCYDFESVGGVLGDVKHGEWIAGVNHSDDTSWGIRISELIVHHSQSPEPKEQDYWTLEDSYDIDVDSGQAGFYDVDYYRNNDSAQPSTFLDEKRQEEEGERWYSACCELTCDTDLGAGVMTGGVVSSSGYGDGSYNLFTMRDSDNQIVAMKIVFIDDSLEVCDDCGSELEFCECDFCECGEKVGDCDCEYDDEEEDK